MSGTVHDWQQKLAEGKIDEDTLDAYFSRWYDVRGVRLVDEKKGIDRRFRRRENGRKSLESISVEYKSDSVAAKTGRVFIETVKNLNMGTWGWAWTCQADMLVYWVKPHHLFIVKPNSIREHLPRWMKVYPRKVAENKNYATEGYVVPLWDFQEACESVRVI